MVSSKAAGGGLCATANTRRIPKTRHFCRACASTKCPGGALSIHPVMTVQERAMFTTAERSPETMNVPDLLALIEERYQAAHRKSLPDLIELASKVERVHHDVADAPLGLADALDRLSFALGLHMEVEEKVLFPAMRGNATEAVAHPIAMMRSEHETYLAELDAIQALAHGFEPPEGACSSWRRLYQGVAELCTSLREQMTLEDKVLFRRFELMAPTRCTCAHG
jgi:regulator of cell morphogenesis and NO signaling